MEASIEKRRPTRTKRRQPETREGHQRQEEDTRDKRRTTETIGGQYRKKETNIDKRRPPETTTRLNSKTLKIWSGSGADTRRGGGGG